MVQWSRALFTLPEDLSLIPHHTWQLKTVCISNYMVLTPSHRCTWRQYANAHKISIKNKQINKQIDKYTDRQTNRKLNKMFIKKRIWGIPLDVCSHVRNHERRLSVEAAIYPEPVWCHPINLRLRGNKRSKRKSQLNAGLVFSQFWPHHVVTWYIP